MDVQFIVYQKYTMFNECAHVHAQHCCFKFTTSTDFFVFEFVIFNIIRSLHV